MVNGNAPFAHTSTATLSPYGKGTDAEACPICNGFVSFRGTDCW